MNVLERDDHHGDFDDLTLGQRMLLLATQADEAHIEGWSDEVARLEDQLAGAVKDVERLRVGLRAALDYLELVPDDSVDYEAALIRVRDAFGGQS
jgi:hypothetical protein